MCASFLWNSLVLNKVQSHIIPCSLQTKLGTNPSLITVDLLTRKGHGEFLKRYHNTYARYALLFILAVITTCLLSYINRQKQYEAILYKLKHNYFDLEAFRSMDFKDNSLLIFNDYNTIGNKTLDNNKNSQDIERIQDNKQDQKLQDITMTMLLNNYECNKKNVYAYKKITKSFRNRIKKTIGYQEHLKRYQTILSDMTYFPVAEDTEEQYTFSYDNSWNTPRTYGGKRRHEGTDIMATCNKRGIYPIVSVSDGIIENKGWLEQGGYRIGVRSKHGGYYYYAHLYSYAPDLEIGDTVIAGQLLGFMGDTGYSKVEGTTGNFAVHLHFGIYYNEGEKETSVNPFYILKYLERNKLYYRRVE